MANLCSQKTAWPVLWTSIRFFRSRNCIIWVWLPTEFFSVLWIVMHLIFVHYQVQCTVLSDTLLSHFQSNNLGYLWYWNQFTRLIPSSPKWKLLLHDENPVWKTNLKNFFNTGWLLQVVSTSYSLIGKSNIYLTDRTKPYSSKTSPGGIGWNLSREDQI